MTHRRHARRFVSLVKLEHTVFALPYAYVGAILAVATCLGRHAGLDHAWRWPAPAAWRWR